MSDDGEWLIREPDIEHAARLIARRVFECDWDVLEKIEQTDCLEAARAVLAFAAEGQR